MLFNLARLSLGLAYVYANPSACGSPALLCPSSLHSVLTYLMISVVGLTPISALTESPGLGPAREIGQGRRGSLGPGGLAFP